ncbi:hypothetical protein EZZ80_22375 [Pseudomonas putida]|nr:hypothetical protein DM483_05275 [Pseudomonas sp. SMT-1]QDW59867.1 hypothetical protein FFH79_024700 [Pseudomonas sp. KBS0802]UZA76077.1 hypothetical protein EZZ80_22375 [Pseudomonas putida]
MAIRTGLGIGILGRGWLVWLQDRPFRGHARSHRCVAQHSGIVGGPVAAGAPAKRPDLPMLHLRPNTPSE